MRTSPIGRPSKLTPEVQETICKYLRAGNTFRTACELAGIAYATGIEWRARGEDRDPERPGDESFAAFAVATRRAEEEAIARCAAVVQKAAIDGNLQAATWFLERRRPDEWGRVDRRTISLETNEPQAVSGLSADQIKARILELAAELGYAPPPGIGPGEVIDVEAQDVELG